MQVSLKLAERLSGAHGMTAAVHRQRDPRAEGGLLRGEKRHRLRHLLHGAGAAQRVRRLGAFQEGRVGRLVQAAALVYLRRHDAGIDRVDADTFGRQLQRHTAGDLRPV